MVPAAEALERQLQALRVCSDLLDGRRTPPWPISEQLRFHLRATRAILDLSTPMYWVDETMAAAEALAPSFDLTQITCTREVVFVDCAFCWFERPRFLFPQGDGQMKQVHAYSWGFGGSNAGEDSGMLFVTAYTVESNCVRSVGGSFVHAGARIADFKTSNDAQADNALRSAFQFVLCASAFLRQKLATAERLVVDRHTRKRLAATGWSGDPVVDIIRMREQESSLRQGEGAAARTYQWRWTVRAHVRQQWYPSLEAHLPIVVGPHVKGPDDRPMKKRGTPLFLVDR